MPRGPKGEKRPRDPAQLAKLMIDIASGEVEDREPTPEEQGKDPAASALVPRIISARNAAFPCLANSRSTDSGY